MAALPSSYPSRRNSQRRPQLRLVAGTPAAGAVRERPPLHEEILVGRAAPSRPRATAQSSGRAASTSFHSARSERSSISSVRTSPQITVRPSTERVRRARSGVLPGIATVGLLVAAWFGAGALRGGSPALQHLSGSVASGSGYVYVVRPGDTLWSIATRLEPNADPRVLVNELASQVPGGTLVVGEKLRLP